MRTFPYMTVDQVMLATGHTSLRKTQARLLTHSKEGIRGEINYLARIPRRTTEQNLHLKPAYTLTSKSKKYFEQKERAVILASLTPSPYTLDHSLAINDILLRALLLERNHP